MLQFEFDGHNSSEYGIIMTGITDNDNLESRSLQLGEKNRYTPEITHNISIRHRLGVQRL